MQNLAGLIVALGGVDNVLEIEPCTTRLRCEVSDPDKVDSAEIRKLGAHGVMLNGHVVQIVVGPDVDVVASDLAEFMWGN